ncbi:DUF4169 family protein [Poseidonocella sedimentorum]|uniref:DUF4169 domain-containing protein n=1 Tax=Poseidonocella sedimentorum TaxID=871652 RepID=A0A1I6DHF9_9RHOB|nr:DUF4169 family protein [Poseidonocella sedimentorum]SFR04873.1 protein of unknown function [Poseidonocella sedimentorum]
MAKVTNLSRFRKDRAKSAKRAQADENAVKFGQTKAQKDKARAEAEKAARELDGKRRD